MVRTQVGTRLTENRGAGIPPTPRCEAEVNLGKISWVPAVIIAKQMFCSGFLVGYLFTGRVRKPCVGDKQIITFAKINEQLPIVGVLPFIL